MTLLNKFLRSSYGVISFSSVLWEDLHEPR